MANNGNQKQKLLTLASILRAETDGDRGLTMPQIIERLYEHGYSAERKAVYRDIRALREAGFDIQKLPKRPVQYALVRSELGFDDVMMLIDIVQSSPFLTERKSNQLVKSLKNLVSDRERKQLARRVHVQGRIRSQSDSVFHNVDSVHDALQRKRKIEFLYFSYGTDLKRKPRHDGRRYCVTPMKIVFSNNNYYLVAYDGAEEIVKTYRIDRMEITQISDDPADHNSVIANYDLDDEFAYRSFSMFHGDAKTVTLRVNAPLMDAVVDRFGKDIEVVKATETHAEVRVGVQVSPQFFGWIAGLNGEVKIRAPRKLVVEYKDWLRQLAG